MQWEYLGLMLLVMMICARIGMAHHAFQKQKNEGGSSLFTCFDSCSVTDYIRLTREETGRIGEWFWVFTSSTAMLVIVVAAIVAGEADVGILVRSDQDFLWPIL